LSALLLQCQITQA